MARRFTPGTSDRISSSTTTDLAGFDWAFGTVALLFYRTVDTGGIEQMVVTLVSSGDRNEFFIDGGTGDVIGVWDNGGSTFVGAVPTGTPMLLGWSKPTGTVTPRGHKYQFNTNTWTHNDGSATQLNSGPLNALVFGSGTVAGTQFLNGEVWAIGMWKRSMTDKEFERLAGGNWLNTAPDFYEQWTDGREVTAMKSTLGKYPVRQTSMTGTTRGVQRPPPGFRMCIQRRRR